MRASTTDRRHSRPHTGRSARFRSLWYEFARAVSWHRRKLAVVCAVAAVLTGLTALAPPRPDLVSAVRVRTDLPGGRVLTATDLRIEDLPAAALPSGALTDVDAVVGRTLAGRVPAAQVLSETDLLGGRRAGGTGRVIAPVRLADGDLTALLADGDVVDVLAADDQSGQARVVAGSVRVVAVPASARDPSSAAGGGLVLVDVDRSTATALAKAAAGAQLSVIWR